MGAKLLDGLSFGKNLRLSIIERIITERLHPSLAIIQVGNRPDSSKYISQKLKAASETGINCEKFNFESSVSESDLLQKIQDLNNNSDIHGILVQLPLPPSISETKVMNAISHNKDVDGFTDINFGRMTSKREPFYVPCTPKGIIALLDHYNVTLEGKNAVVVGRSRVVGLPVSILLQQRNATVTLCHSLTSDLQSIVSKADILVVAIGKPKFIHGSWIKPHATVVDVGFNYIPDQSRKSGQRIVGDVDFESAKKVAEFIAPVPGGVGPMTITMLMENTLEAAIHSAKSEPAKFAINTINILTPVPSDIDIAKAQTPLLITRIAANLGILSNEVEQYGDFKAKVNLQLLERLKDQKLGKYIIVSGITPTSAGEGKSTTTYGLVQALGAHLNKKAIACVRQPSLGPTFGIKGGAAGGGYAQCIPMEEFNLHMTGDIHAIGAANNLLVAAIDTRIFHEKTQSDKALFSKFVPEKNGQRTYSKYMLKRLAKLGIEKKPDELSSEEIKKLVRLDIDSETIAFNRVVDVNDRLLRRITIGQGDTEKGITRTTEFDITVASECMSILALSTSISDMRDRLGKMVIALNIKGEKITTEDLGIAGSLAALLKDAIKPNLMQTLEGTPVFVHAGPFANISIGQSSIIADQMALRLADYCVTEAGFSTEIGLEKFCDIKCRTSGLKPNAAVIVATVRALKLHGDGDLKIGSQNLQRHIKNAKKFGLPVIVAINKFKNDSKQELDVIRQVALKAGAEDAIVTNHWAEGGKGAVDLARAVIQACEKPVCFEYLYSNESSITQKIETICKKMYGAKSVTYSAESLTKIDKIDALGYSKLPICIAKTQYSLSTNPLLKNSPIDFNVSITDLRLSAGAGFIYPLTSTIQTIPGLPTAPAYLEIDIGTDGEMYGIF